ncbi:MAG: acetolactate decarboxylase [Methanotrichaceae archaeon]|nr:acetolactate decarboxylase [Methanotrichaceae archaeon]
MASAVAFAAFLALAPAESSAPNSSKDVLFQSSAITALQQGVFDGSMTYEELASHGDFGIGTFNSLDGEMVELDDQFYQIKADGSIYAVNNSMKTPFAIVTDFASDKEMKFYASGDGSANLTMLQRYLDNQMPSENIFYAIRVHGLFDYIKTRSVPAQAKPYTTLAEATENQSVFEMFNQSGTLVGFWYPAFANGVNVPGYHFHFLNDKRTAGGHVLDLRMKNASVAFDYALELFMDLPQEKEFLLADLSKANQEDLEKAESNPAPTR